MGSTTTGAAAAVFNIAVLGFVLVGVATLRYELRDDGLCVIMGGLCMRRLPYSDIEDVNRGRALWNEHWNRLSFDPMVIVRRRSGLIRNFVINPPRTDEFIEQLRARIGR